MNAKRVLRLLGATSLAGALFVIMLVGLGVTSVHSVSAAGHDAQKPSGVITETDTMLEPETIPLEENNYRNLMVGLSTNENMMMSTGWESLAPCGKAHSITTVTNTAVVTDESVAYTVLILDASESMRGQKFQAAKDASLAFVSTQVTGTDSIAIVVYSTTAKVELGFTTNFTLVRQIIASLPTSTSGGTNMVDGLGKAWSLTPTIPITAAQYAVLLSDGESNVCPSGPDCKTQAINLAGQMKSAGVTIYAVALGSDADTVTLQAVSSPGNLLIAPTPAELESIFSSIGRSIHGVILEDVVLDIRYLANASVPLWTTPTGRERIPGTFINRGWWDFGDLEYGEYREVQIWWDMLSTTPEPITQTVTYRLAGVAYTKTVTSMQEFRQCLVDASLTLETPESIPVRGTIPLTITIRYSGVFTEGVAVASQFFRDGRWLSAPNNPMVPITGTKTFWQGVYSIPAGEISRTSVFSGFVDVFYSTAVDVHPEDNVASRSVWIYDKERNFLAVSADPARLSYNQLTNGQVTTTLSLTLTDYLGRPAQDVITLTTTFGRVMSPTLTTDAFGRATTSLVFDRLQSGVAVVTSTSRMVQATAEVTLGCETWVETSARVVSVNQGMWMRVYYYPHNLADRIDWQWPTQFTATYNRFQETRGNFSAPGVYTLNATIFSPVCPAMVVSSTWQVEGRNPIAEAGPNRLVVTSATVRLDGSASHGLDGSTIAAYGWKQTAGPAVILLANGLAATFAAPNQVADLTFTLIVTDTAGKVSPPDAVTVSVRHIVFLPVITR